jgi:hypothetical protein
VNGALAVLSSAPVGRRTGLSVGGAVLATTAAGGGVEARIGLMDTAVLAASAASRALIRC